MNPYAAPGEAGSPGSSNRRGRYTARLTGDVLVVSRDAELPSVCVKCGKHDDIMRRSTPLQWTPVWARFLMFCLVGLIVMLITTKRATLAIPLCVPCNTRWTAARNATIGAVVVLVGSFIVMRMMDEPQLGLVFMAVAVIGFVVVGITYARPRMLRVKRIDDAEIHLAGVDPGAAKEIVEGSTP